MHPQTTNWLEQLSDLSFFWIAVLTAVLTTIRIAVSKRNNTFTRSVGEFADSILLAVVLVFLLLRPFAVQAFFIPSASMEPTLLGNDNVGDKILVNKFIYRISHPKTGDVVVFIPPKDVEEDVPGTQPNETVHFIKRLVGQSGDELESVAGRFQINGINYTHEVIRRKLYDAGVYGDDVPPDELDSNLQSFHHVKFLTNGVEADKKFISEPDLLRILQFPPDSTIQIEPGYDMRNGQRVYEPFIAEDPAYDFKYVNGGSLRREPMGDSQELTFNGVDVTAQDWFALNNLPPEPLPKDSYFMMGDNRNYSKDSTFWGPIGRKRIVGRADFIMWPLQRMQRIVPAR